MFQPIASATGAPSEIKPTATELPHRKFSSNKFSNFEKVAP